MSCPGSSGTPGSIPGGGSRSESVPKAWKFDHKSRIREEAVQEAKIGWHKKGCATLGVRVAGPPKAFCEHWVTTKHCLRCYCPPKHPIGHVIAPPKAFCGCAPVCVQVLHAHDKLLPPAQGCIRTADNHRRKRGTRRNQILYLEKMKITTGKTDLGHFWYTDFWIQDPRTTGPQERWASSDPPGPAPCKVTKVLQAH